MKIAIIFAALFAVALAAPAAQDSVIVRYDNEQKLDGYSFGFDTSDGTSVNEEGQLENAGTDDEAISVRGSFSYVGDDGQTYSVNYIADKNGFQPQGAHLPQPVA